MGLFGGRNRKNTSVARSAEFTPVDGEQLFVGEMAYQGALTALLKGRGHRPSTLATTTRPISERFVARLTPERNNPYDANAVAVHVDGNVVAYLSRANATAYRRAFGASVAEVPVCLWVKVGGQGIVSVWPVD